MEERDRRRRSALALAVLALLAAGRAEAKQFHVTSFSAGLAYDHFARTVAWGGGGPSKLRAHAFGAQAEVGFSGGLVFSFAAGFSLVNPSRLAFGTLPISLEFRGANMSGLSLAAEAAAPVKRAGRFEIGAAGRIVYSSGAARSWPLEGFAVEGRATGRPDWLELSAGPRLAYLAFGPRIVPFAEVSARLLWAGFRMAETLGELGGEETSRVRGDFALALALGAEVRVGGPVKVKVKAGLAAGGGGADGLFSIGALYGF
ncbi:MAG TPA: hypothetical protein PLP83_10360 [Candidatus Aminicenantes bacterium]|nr:hypothetical protein [Candidatus Aminicenantes bacterium]